MKKILFLLAGFFLVACSTDTDETGTLKDSSLNLEAQSQMEYSGLEISGFETTQWDLVHVKPNGDELHKGRIFVSNDCHNLTVQIEGADEANLGIYESENEYPAKNGKKENVTPAQEYTEEDATIVGPEDSPAFVWTFDLDDFNSETLYIFANGGGHSWGGDLQWGNALYFAYDIQTAGCEDVCTYGYGYWKNHTPLENPGNQENQWPTLEDNSLELGTDSYSIEELVALLRTEVGGNGMVSLAQHLISAKLNVLNGADPTDVAEAIVAADDFIGGDDVLTTDVEPEDVEDIKNILEAYNEGEIGPGHCEDSEE